MTPKTKSIRKTTPGTASSSPPPSSVPMSWELAEQDSELLEDEPEVEGTLATKIQLLEEQLQDLKKEARLD